MLTAGSQQALDLIGKLFISPGRYGGGGAADLSGRAAGLSTATSRPIATCRKRRCGAGRTDLPHGALGYFVPDFANPTGVSLTLEERKAPAGSGHRAGHDPGRGRGLSRVALRRRVDADRAGPSTSSGRAGIDNARTLFLGTLSKTLSPALRIGWVCGPKPVIEKLVLLKQGADLHVSTINQMVAHRAVSEGYDQHLHRLRGAYGAKGRVDAGRPGADHARGGDLVASGRRHVRLDSTCRKGSTARPAGAGHRGRARRLRARRAVLRRGEDRQRHPPELLASRPTRRSRKAWAGWRG